MVEKYKWFGVIGVLLPLLILTGVLFLQNIDSILDRRNFIFRKNLTGLVVEKKPSQHGYHELRIKGNNDSSYSIETSWFNVRFTKFIEVGDSIKSSPGDSLIIVFRKDTEYVFRKDIDQQFQKYTRKLN